MKQTPKFLMMLATAGLALSMAAHAKKILVKIITKELMLL